MRITVNCQGADGSAERLFFNDATADWTDRNTLRVRGRSLNGTARGCTQDIEFPRERIASVETQDSE